MSRAVRIAAMVPCAACYPGARNSTVATVLHGADAALGYSRSRAQHPSRHGEHRTLRIGLLGAIDVLSSVTSTEPVMTTTVHLTTLQPAVFVDGFEGEEASVP